MNDQNSNFIPDFLLIPYGIHTDKNLDSTDKIVFAVVYWFEHLKDGKCTASNETIATMAITTAGSVKNSLLKLENNHHIVRKYKDELKLEREYIKTNHSFRQGGGHPLVTGGSPTGAQIKNTITRKDNTDTPPAVSPISSFTAEDTMFPSYERVDEDGNPIQSKVKQPNQNKAYEAALAHMAKIRSSYSDDPFCFTGNRVGLYKALKEIKKLMSSERAYELWEEMCASEWWQERGFDLWTIKSQFLKKGK